MVQSEGRSKNANDGHGVIFAIVDYCRYVRRTGRFARDFRKSVMGAAFQGTYPVKAIAMMQPGDFFLVQTLNSRIAWLVMYLTSSEVSHVAMYAGESKIIHATFGGVVMEPAESLFTMEARVLPAKLDLERTGDITEVNEKYLGTPYGWDVVMRKGMRILNGRDWGYFRWKFAADIGLTVIALDVPLFFWLGLPVLSWFLPIYAVILLFNRIRWKLSPLKFGEGTGKPCDMLTMVQMSGGTLMFDAYNLAKQQGRIPDSSA